MGVTLDGRICMKGSDVTDVTAVPVVIIISDPGQDLDDEMALVLLRCCTDLGLLEARCVVTNLHPAMHRALLARGTLDQLGLTSVPVGYGSDGGDTQGTHTVGRAPYAPELHSQRAAAVLPGPQLLYQTFVQAVPNSLTLCLISSIKDAALFLRQHESLFVTKIQEVVVMGGVHPPTHHGALLVPDSAHNNEFDADAAAFFYKRCQELKVRMVVVTRHTAYKCPMDRSVYDQLEASGSPVGRQLSQRQQDSIEQLWRRSCSKDEEQRMGLPARCDKDWFRDTFCAEGDALNGRGVADSVWDLIQSFNMYDSLALLAAIPALRTSLFEPVLHEVDGVTHQIIGVSGNTAGITTDKARQCSQFFKAAFRAGLEGNSKHDTREQFMRQVRETALMQEVCCSSSNRFLASGPLRRVVVCLGHGTVDSILQVHTVPSPPAKIMAQRLIQTAGGMATNAATAVSRLAKPEWRSRSIVELETTRLDCHIEACCKQSCNWI